MKINPTSSVPSAQKRIHTIVCPCGVRHQLQFADETYHIASVGITYPDQPTSPQDTLSHQGGEDGKDKVKVVINRIPDWMDCNCKCHKFDDNTGMVCPHCHPEDYELRSEPSSPQDAKPLKKVLLDTDQNHPAIKAYVEAVKKGQAPLESGQADAKPVYIGNTYSAVNSIGVVESDQASPDVERAGEWEPSAAQMAYWAKMRGRRGADTSRWKGSAAGKAAVHQWLVATYGNPSICENPKCNHRSTWFDWALKTGKTYDHVRDNFLRLCRSCHRKYDLTPEKKAQAIRNLHSYKPGDESWKKTPNGRKHLNGRR